MKTYDSVVVGGGPAGVTAALYLLRSGASVARVEQLAPGGQMLLTESIDNYPGFPQGVKGLDLADLFEAHLAAFPLDRYAETVSAMECRPGDCRLRVGEEWIGARAVIICTGARYKRLRLPREEELLGRGVSYCALCDGHFFRGQDIAVVGGGNAALEESLYLAKLVRTLHLVHRRGRFRGAQVYQDKVAAHPRIETLFDTVPEELLGEGQLTGVTVRNVKTGARRTLAVSGLFLFIGFEPQGGFFPAELQLDADGFIVTDAEMRTNLPGVFAAGDIRSKLCRQVTTAVGDGATAANAAFAYLEQLHA